MRIAQRFSNTAHTLLVPPIRSMKKLDIDSSGWHWLREGVIRPVIDTLQYLKLLENRNKATIFSSTPQPGFSYFFFYESTSRNDHWLEVNIMLCHPCKDVASKDPHTGIKLGVLQMELPIDFCGFKLCT